MPTEVTEERKLAAIMFTDMVGSTQLKQEFGDREGLGLIRRHHSVLRELLSEFKGAEEISTAGDSFFLLFAIPSDAVKFALLLGARLRALSAEIGRAVLDRVGIHVGEILVEAGEGAVKPVDLHGIEVDTCSRVMSLGQPNQILLTRFVFDSARQLLRGAELKELGGPSGLKWLNHGPYVLKGVEEPLDICEVGVVGVAPLCPPGSSDKARRHASVEEEPVLGWRPALEQTVPGTRWVLEKKLGEGGFGEVWLGRHETLKERRVFKFCFRADRVRCLKREVTLFRVLKERVGHHPNIVGIQEVFFDQPPFYIVMDYAEATDLRTWAESQGGVEKIPLATRLEIVAQVAEALQAAHEAGVIHRDVKPSNILVSNLTAEIGNQKLGIKLTDFGIGQVMSQETLAGMTRMGFTETMSPGSSSHTGTQLYMAPELLAGNPASPRSDIYSLGVVLYQLLVGDFSRPLTTDWARRIADPSLREDLEKCFAGDPQERFASAGELAKSLRSLRERREISAAREKKAYRQQMIRRASAGLLAIAVVVLIGWLTSGRSGGTHQNVLAEDSGTKNPQADNAYKRAKAFIAIEKTEPNLDQAVKAYEQAIELDPNFALAYVGLADAWHDIYNNYHPEPSLMRDALKAVNKALSLNSKLADAYVIRGKITFTPASHWDAAGAVKDFRLALKINPNVALAHSLLAFVYWHVGLLGEALAELDQALTIDRFNTYALYLKGATLISQGRSPEAAPFLDSINEQAFPSPASMVWQKGVCLFCRGQSNEALKYVERQMAAPKLKSELESYPVINSVLAILHATRGETNQAEARLDIAMKGDERRMDFHHTTEYIAGAYALLDRKKDAMRWLRRTADEGFPCYPYFETDPSLNNLRNDPDFKKFLKEQKVLWEHNKSRLLPEATAPSHRAMRTAIAALFVLGLITVLAGLAFRKSRRLRLHEAT